MEIKWTNGQGGLRRAQHGIEKSTYYTVGNGEAALSLEVRDGEGLCMFMHLPFPGTVEAVKDEHAPQPCALIERGTCWCGITWYSWASQLFVENGVPLEATQPESLWRALEEQFLESYAEAIRYFRGLKRCDKCNATGVCK